MFRTPIRADIAQLLRPFMNPGYPETKVKSLTNNRDGNFRALIETWRKFKAEDIAVSVSKSDNTIAVEGKNANANEKGQEGLYFAKKFVLPEEYDVERVEITFGELDGVITVTVPRVKKAECKL